MVICFAQMDVSEREGDFDIFLNPSFGGQIPLRSLRSLPTGVQMKRFHDSLLHQTSAHCSISSTKMIHAARYLPEVLFVFTLFDTCINVCVLI